MLEIKHTLCPSCSVGCGLNVIINNGEIVGTFPYKRHPVNAGKNCLNGRNSIECYQNKFDKAIVSKSETDIEKAIEDVSKELGSADSSDVTIICSGNNDMEEIEAICDRVAIMDFGKIIALGTIDELIDSISDEENVSVEFDKVDSKLVDLVKKINGVKDCTSENNHLNIKLDKKLANISKILSVLLENNIIIRSINTDKPNLEMVFLALTGKKLRD